jgi:hypothetical protein
MTRDWLLTLLAMSPFVFAATMVVLALTRKSAQNEGAGRAANARAYDGADRMEDSATDVRLVGIPERQTGAHPLELTVADFH